MRRVGLGGVEKREGGVVGGGCVVAHSPWEHPPLGFSGAARWLTRSPRRRRRRRRHGRRRRRRWRRLGGSLACHLQVFTFIDLAGHERYIKTTVSGMTGQPPPRPSTRSVVS